MSKQQARWALRLSEDAARELPNLPLEDALQLVHLYFERGSPKAEPAARRWLVRYLSEGTPGLDDVAKVTANPREASGFRTSSKVHAFNALASSWKARHPKKSENSAEGSVKPVPDQCVQDDDWDD